MLIGKITTKTGKVIFLHEDELKELLKENIHENIEELVENNLGECTCQFNEANNHCYCEGGLLDDDYEIDKIEFLQESK